MATAWPSALPDPFVDFHETWDMPTVTSQTEMGVDRSRPLFTEPNRTYTVTWTYLSADEKSDITDFFESIGWGAGDITWTHPGDSSTIYVRLVGPVTFRSIGNNKWALTIQFKRVPDSVIT